MKENPILLLIDTATEICSVAVSKGKDILGCCETDDGNAHSKNLLPYIDKVLSENHLVMKDINGVVISIGPGSYTGLRIGVSTAKGIAYSLNIPVITISTLESIAFGASCSFKNIQGFQIAPMIDARRMEVFTARYNDQLQLIEPVNAAIIEEDAYSELLENQPILFCGNGMPKCRDILSKHPNAHFSEEPLSAKHMLLPALLKWQKEEFADTAYFEPFYLKEYVAAKPHVKGL